MEENNINNNNPLAIVEAEVVELKPAPRPKIKYRPGYERGKELADRTKLPNGLTKQEEKFCLLYVRLGPLNTKKAFYDAGYVAEGNWWNTKAKRILGKAHIKKRIAEIEANKEAMDIDVSMEEFITMGLKLHNEAKQAGDFKAAKDTLELIGRAKGFVIDRKVSLEGKVTAKANLSPEERMERVKKLAGIVGVKL